MRSRRWSGRNHPKTRLKSHYIPLRPAISRAPENGGAKIDHRAGGLAHELKRALATYTESGGKGRTALDKEQAVRVMLEKHEVCCGLFHGFDRTAWTTGSPADRLQLLPAALEHVLAQEDGKARCLKAVRELSQAFALAVPHPRMLVGKLRGHGAYYGKGGGRLAPPATRYSGGPFG